MRKREMQPWRLRLFGGFITISGSDVFRFHVHVGSFIFCMESKELHADTKNRRNK